MIQNVKTKNNDLFEIWNFVKTNVHSDFYLTDNNKRVFITYPLAFKSLIRQSHSILFSKDKDVNGVIMLWKGKNGNSNRSYVKINAIDENVAERLLTVLLWNQNKDLYIKINKYSPYLKVFEYKKFHFVGGRGKELLLRHSKRTYTSKSQ